MTHLTRKHLKQLRLPIYNAAHQYVEDNYPSGHRWYQCDAVAKMSPDQEPPYSQCQLPKAHPGDCMVRWQDALWWVSPFSSQGGHPPRLNLIVKLGGPNDVKLIEEPDFGVIWDHIVLKLDLPDFGYDTRRQFLKWDYQVQKWTL